MNNDVWFILILSLIIFSCSAEKSFYKKAESVNTIESYEEYLSNYESGKYESAAKQKIKELIFSQKRDSAFTKFVQIFNVNDKQNKSQIIISPSNKILMGTPHSIEFTDLPSDDVVTLHAYRRIWKHVIYSFAIFKLDSNGQISLSKAKPLNGTYHRADSLGIFWSMTKPSQNNLQLPFKVTDLKNNTIYLNIEHDGKIIANEQLELINKHPNIISKKINNDSLTAIMHYPADSLNLPAVLLLSGSEGGNKNISQMAKIIASHGYAVIALAYFKIDPLPEHLENIPLEYFFKSIEWIKNRSFVDSTRLVVAGGSRGGELALLLASQRTDIRGVIAVEPSCVLWQGLPHSPGTVLFPEPAWTLNGEALPYLDHRFHLPTLVKFGNGSKQIDLMNLYKGILDDEDKIQPALIKVENIKGPILLVAGQEGRVWPAYKMCKMIENRLNEMNFKYTVISHYYKDAGHYVLITSDLSPTINYKYDQIMVGGTNSGNASSQIASWNRMIKFLNKYF